MQPLKACFEITMRLLTCAILVTLLTLLHSKAAVSSDVCPGNRIEVTTVGFTPYVRLNVGGKEGWFLVDTASSYSFIDAHTIRGNDKYPELNMIGFPYVESEHFIATDLSRFPSPRGEGLLGLIGENILSLVSVQFQYDADSAHMVISSDPCSPVLEGNPDFGEIKQTGYYVRDRIHLNNGEPNIPRLYVRIGVTEAPVYLDSGNADGAMFRPIGAVLMNKVFVGALQTSGVLLDPEEAYGPVACPALFSPRNEIQTRWKVQNQPLEVTNEAGSTLFQYYQPTIEATPKDCNDIASNQNLLGTIGASYFQRWGTVILDAPGERVWVRKYPLALAPKLPRSDADWRPDEGTGTYISPYGDRYDGEFLNGHPEGQGTLTYTNKSIYNGNFHNGHLQGHGTLKQYNRDYYDGNFENDSPEGQGTLTWADQNSFTGPFHNGLPNGQGTLTIHSTRQSYTVTFRAGVLVTPLR